MYNRKTNLEQLINILLHRVSELEQQMQKHEESIDFVVSKVRELDHIAGDNQNLRSELSFYSPDYEDD